MAAEEENGPDADAVHNEQSDEGEQQVVQDEEEVLEIEAVENNEVVERVEEIEGGLRRE